MKKIKLYTPHQWTKEEIKKLARVWDSSTSDEIAEEIGVSRQQVNYMATVIRKAGYDLPKKRKNGNLSILIKEALNIR